MPRSSARTSSNPPSNSSKSDFDRRNEIISLARYGKITPEAAEAEAAANGWKPFATQPSVPEFEPMRESRWTITMAIAWIAWRDLKLVRENSQKFSSECWHWFFREWQQPDNSGERFQRHEGWFLESWSEPTAVRLLIEEKWLERHNALPPTTRLSVTDAEGALWDALGNQQLVAEALDSSGIPVDVPPREWSYLKLFEEGKRDSLKYDVLDRVNPYREVKLRRHDVLRLWPPPEQPQAEPETHCVEPEMYEPLTRPGDEGLVPLCAALHWIMTARGTVTVELDDRDAWRLACHAILPFLHSGEIALVGMPRGGSLSEQIPGYALGAIKILPPLNAPIADILLNSPPHIATSIFLGIDTWREHFSDRLFLSGEAVAAWTHLQLRKSEVLQRWPRPYPTNDAEAACVKWLLEEIRKSPQKRPRTRAKFSKEAKQKFRRLGKRQFDRAWDKAVEQAPAWKKPGPTPRSDHPT